MQIGIVADDLTGAADSVAPFAARGLGADLQWAAGGKLPADLAESEARAWCVGTRDLPASREAAIRRLTRAATRRLQRFAPSITYKKIDSTLRGHLRPELDAMRTELPGRLAVVCPAFPANGRTVRAGSLHLQGAATHNVRVAFSMQEDRLVRDLPLEVLRSEPDRLSERMRKLHGGGVHTLFCDAETNADLSALAAAVLEMGDLCLPVGSAGLSAAIAARVPAGDFGPERLRSVRDELAAGPVLVVVGSMHASTRRQASRLAELARIDPIVVPLPDDSSKLTSAGMRELLALPDEILRRFEAGERIVLVITPDRDCEAMRATSGGLFYLHLLPQTTTPHGFGLIVTGGHTAQQLLQSSGAWDGISIRGEFEPGVVAGRIRASSEFGAAMDGCPIVLKSGGFGNDDTLAHCLGLA